MAGTEGGKGIFSDSAPELMNIPLDRLKASFAKLIEKLEVVTSELVSSTDGLTLKELEVGVEISAEGGVYLIGTAKAGAVASVKLTFSRAK